MRAGPAGNIGGGAVEAEQNVPVGVGAANQPHQLAGDVAGVEVGEDQDVGVAAQLAAGQLSGGDFGNQRGIHLEVAVKLRIQLGCERFLFGQGAGGLHFARRGMLTRCL